MRKHYSTLRDKDVQDHAATLLQKHLRLKDYTQRTTVAVVFHVLFFAAATLTSICAACQRLRDAPCDDAGLQSGDAALELLTPQTDSCIHAFTVAEKRSVSCARLTKKRRE